MKSFIIPFNKITMHDLPLVGGKNASLSEMIKLLSPFGINVPDGFAITVDAIYHFLSFNALSTQIDRALDSIDRIILGVLSEASLRCREHPAIILSLQPSLFNVESIQFLSIRMH